jgi:uncharacterized membrane protein
MAFRKRNNNPVNTIRCLLQPLAQIIFYCILYAVNWLVVLKFNLLRDPNVWQVTRLYIVGSFVFISLVLGLFMYFSNAKSKWAVYVVLLFYIMLTMQNFMHDPKIIAMIWVVAALSILLANVVFNKVFKSQQSTKE